MYTSRSSGSALGSFLISPYGSWKASEIYFGKISPRATCLYSPASMCPRICPPRPRAFPRTRDSHRYPSGTAPVPDCFLRPIAMNLDALDAWKYIIHHIIKAIHEGVAGIARNSNGPSGRHVWSPWR